MDFLIIGVFALLLLAVGYLLARLVDRTERNRGSYHGSEGSATDYYE